VYVLAKIDRQVGLAIELVGGQRRAGDRGQDAIAHCRQPVAIRRPFLVRCEKALHQLAGGRVVAEIERAVLAHHASTGHMRAIWSHQPAGRPVMGTTRKPTACSRSSAP